MLDRVLAEGPRPPSVDAEVWKARYDVLARAATPEQVEAAERVVEYAVELARRNPFTFEEAVRAVLMVLPRVQRFSELERFFVEER